MEGLTYRKMICSEGHESRPYAASELLPKRCPVCNQPYDRRIHGPFFCRGRTALSRERNQRTERNQRSSPPAVFKAGKSPPGRLPAGKQYRRIHLPERRCGLKSSTERRYRRQLSPEQRSSDGDSGHRPAWSFQARRVPPVQIFPA